MTGLRGRSVVVTRAPHQAAELAALLTERGAIPLLYPCIDIEPPEDPRALDDALRAAAQGGIDWLVLTSANTVIALEKRLAELQLALDGLKVAAIGPATASAAEQRLGMHVDLMPEEAISESLAEALNALTPSSRSSLRSDYGQQNDTGPLSPSPSGPGVENKGTTAVQILLPQSAIADDQLAEQLRLRGAALTVVPAYRTVIGMGGIDLPALLNAHEVDAITFTSGSTITNGLKRLDAEGSGRDALDGVVVACIGPKTADVARAAGLSVRVMPHEHTLEALVAALDSHFLTEATGV